MSDDLELDTLVIHTCEHWKYMLIDMDIITLLFTRNTYHLEQLCGIDS